MKVCLLCLFIFLSVAGSAQPSIRGSVSKDATPNIVDVWFKANYTNAPGEYINYFQISIAIPAAGNGSVMASAVAVNGFQDMGTLLIDGPYTEGSERVFNFGYLNPAPPSVNNFAWTSGLDFIGVKVTFSGGSGNAQVKMVDFTNAGGGANTNSYYGIVTNTGDKTDYLNLFYQIPGLNVLGTDGNGDQYVQTVDLVALPVMLLDFTGHKDGNKNQLRWATASEQNLPGFEIQRSVDRVHFEKIGFVKSLAAGGNSNQRLNYAFTDASPGGLLQYYRLRTTDPNGESRFSNIVTIRREKPLMVTIDDIFPNPAKTVINLRINEISVHTYRLLVNDMSGKTLFSYQVRSVPGVNVFPVNVSNLAAGGYILRLENEEGTVQRTFIKK